MREGKEFSSIKVEHKGMTEVIVTTPSYLDHLVAPKALNAGWSMLLKT